MICIGKIKRYCTNFEDIENYEQAIADTTQTWQCHHRLETHFSDGNPRPKNALITSSELKALDMYYHRPASELIFLTASEHARIGSVICESGEANPMYGKSPSKETRKKLSKANKGKKRSDETKHKISESKKGNINMLGKHHTEKSKLKTSSSMKGLKFYNNGVKTVRAKVCPEGFVSGRLICKPF